MIIVSQNPIKCLFTFSYSNKIFQHNLPVEKNSNYLSTCMLAIFQDYFAKSYNIPFLEHFFLIY